MLETVWFVLWGALWGVYFMLDGFDLGVGMLMPFLARNEEDRRGLYNAIGPFWDGNEVWLITAGGAMFAAFPGAYATLFSALYAPLMMVLFALIIRGAALGLRPEVHLAKWRRFWDWCFVGGSFVPALLLGVVFANLFRGIPLDATGTVREGLMTLLNPYGLLGGIMFVMLFGLHGALWAAVKTDGELAARAGHRAKRLRMAVLVAVIGFVTASGRTGLFENYYETPILFIIPAAALGSLGWMIWMIKRREWLRAWYGSAGAIFLLTMFGMAGIYPSLVPSSIDEAFSRTIHNSASTPLTLGIMLGVAGVCVPAVIIYQIWVYRVFRGKGEGHY